MFHLKQFIALVFIIGMFVACNSNAANNFDWDQILESNDRNFQNVIKNKEQFELQIRYTQINRDQHNIPHLSSYNFNVDSTLYFYPASTIKMPVSFLALQRLNELSSHGPDIDMNTAIVHDSLRQSQTAARLDNTNENGLPSIAQYINKVFVVSDNDAYNRLYEFLGQDYINNELKEKGVFSNSRIVTRVGVGVLSPNENKYTNQVRFLDEKGNDYVIQKAKFAVGKHFEPLQKEYKPKGFYDEKLDSVMLYPFDMSKKNFINIIDLESALQRVIIPEIFDESQRFDLADDDYNFLYQAMSKYPKDYNYLRDIPEMNYDGFVKFFMFGDSKEDIPAHIHIYNKVGYAYGYLTDCAYIFDAKNNIEFFLTATMLVNENQIFNDGQYEYDEVGIPFLAELGRKIYDYEIQRERTHQPDLLKFVVD